jgi:hypothetical protein
VLIVVLVFIVIVVLVAIVAREGKTHETATPPPPDEIKGLREMMLVDVLIIIVVFGLAHAARDGEAGDFAATSFARQEERGGRAASFAAFLEFSVECFFSHDVSFSGIDNPQRQATAVRPAQACECWPEPVL